MNEIPTIMMPSAPAIVRCKNCVHYHPNGTYKACDALSGKDGSNIPVEDDFFCAFGEKNYFNKGKTGEWVLLGHLMRPMDHPYSLWYKCSLCGYEEYTLFFPAPGRCPHCGADMRGEDDERT